MSQFLFNDMVIFHNKFKVNDAVRNLSPEMLREFLAFRVRFLDEEMNELKKSIDEKNSEEIVDALIDLIVVAAGTLNAYDVNGIKAWDQVFDANMKKQPGVKASRPNPFGLPDMVKPAGWVGPSHAGNHGLFTKTFE